MWVSIRAALSSMKRVGVAVGMSWWSTPFLTSLVLLAFTAAFERKSGGPAVLVVGALELPCCRLRKRPVQAKLGDLCRKNSHFPLVFQHVCGLRGARPVDLNVELEPLSQVIEVRIELLASTRELIDEDDTISHSHSTLAAARLARILSTTPSMATWTLRCAQPRSTAPWNSGTWPSTCLKRVVSPVLSRTMVCKPCF